MVASEATGLPHLPTTPNAIRAVEAWVLTHQMSSQCLLPHLMQPRPGCLCAPQVVPAVSDEQGGW